MIISDIMDADLPADYFDGVWVSNFLEHLPDQNAVADLLGKLHAAMTVGGRIAIMGPNFKYCQREYFDCADHTVILTHLAAAEHLYAAGFEIESVAPRFLPFSFRGVLPPSPRLTRAYLSRRPCGRCSASSSSSSDGRLRSAGAIASPPSGAERSLAEPGEQVLASREHQDHVRTVPVGPGRPRTSPSSRRR